MPIKTMGVVGLGYVGLPLAVEFAKAGVHVIGIEINSDKVDLVNQGVSYIEDVGSSELKQVVDSGHLKATADFAALAETQAISICVPTPLGKTRDPDISYILDATKQVARFLKKGTLVVLESTTYPGTTEDVMLVELEKSGLRCGKDFYLCFSPERVDPGNKVYQTKNTPKVIGGITAECTKIGVELYSRVIDTVVPVSDARTAEMVKLVENTFRAVNIGLVNELAIIADKLDLDVFEVINAASTKPFGYMTFYPGPGLGGHCIPIDPLYLSWKLRSYNYTTKFIELADQINRDMPSFVVDRVAAALNAKKKCVNGSTVLLLGVAYKKDIDDVRESPAIEVASQLLRRGAQLEFHDPYIEKFSLDDGRVLTSAELSADLLRRADCVVVITDHRAFDYANIAETTDLIVDTRNAFAGIQGKATIVGLTARAIR